MDKGRRFKNGYHASGQRLPWTPRINENCCDPVREVLAGLFPMRVDSYF